MADYPYEGQLIADPVTFQRAANAQITVYDAADVANTAPLALKDSTGLPLTNPLVSTADAFTVPFYAPSQDIKLVGAGLTVFVSSAKGMRDAAAAAADAAQTAASEAVAAAGDRVTTAAVNGAGKLILTKATGAQVDAGAVVGPPGVPGPPGQNGSNVLPTDAAIKQAITTPGTETATALSATYAPASLVSAVAAKLDAASSPLGPVSFPRKPNYEMITTFQAGHGWDLTGFSAGGTGLAADTVDYVLGTQSLKGVTAGGTQQVRATKLGMTPMDFTGKTFAVLVKVDNIDNLDGLPALIGHGGFAHYRSVKLMPTWQGVGASAPGWSGAYQWFHGELTDTQTVVGTPNMAAVTDIRVMAYDHGTPLTVNIQAVAVFTKPTDFPNGVVSITWDDNLLSQYTLARQATDKWGDGMTAYVIVDKLGVPAEQDNGAGGRFSTAQAHELEDLHGWEIGGHAFTQAKHDVSATNTLAELEAEMLGLKSFLRKEGFRGADGYAWPQGNNNPAKAAVVARYFSHARHTGGTYASLLLDRPMRVQALNLTSDVTVATYKAHIDHAKLHGKHLVLMGHQVRASGAAGNTNINLADLQAIVDYCHQVNVPIRTMGEVFRVTNRQNLAAAAAPTTPSTDSALTLMMAAKTATKPYTAGDDFNRVDNLTGAGTAPSGQVWTNAVGTVNIVGRKLVASAAANSMATMDAGISDYEMRVKLTGSTSSGGNQVYAVFRAVDAQNYLRFGFSGGNLIASRITGNLLGASIVDLGAFTASELIEAEMVIRAVGSSITISCLGRTHTFTETQGQTSKLVGITQNNTATAGHSITVRTP